MIRALLDTNIMLDSFLQRAPFSDDADNILRANDRRLITGYVTASSILDIFYFSSLIRRQDMGYNRKDAIGSHRGCTLLPGDAANLYGKLRNFEAGFGFAGQRL